MEWYLKTTDEVVKELGTDASGGLASTDAASRLASDGPNALTEQKRESTLIKLVKQFTEFIILVLIGAAIVAGVLGEWIDAAAIIAIVILNGVIGFMQEAKAERVIEALKKLSAPIAKVFRDGELSTIDASLLVAGDVLALEAGDNIPADCRLIESLSLRIEEAPLTGESHPIDKTSTALTDAVPLADRVNMAYMGTTAVYGRGRAVVIGTGMATEMGKIARMLQEVKTEPTPLQRKLSEFGRLLVYAAGGICALIFVLGVLRGEDAIEMLLTSVSLAVAAIPEGLPAVVTIVLALGIQRMVKRHALIRKLPSVETLGSASVIASDKTGTLTQNQMTVKRVTLATGDTLSVSGSGYSPEGAFYRESSEIDPKSDTCLVDALRVSLLCNTARVRQGEGGAWEVIGDPTEAALISLAGKAGLTRAGVEAGLTFVGEAPFDADRKMMTTVYVDASGTYHSFTKGAPERMLALSTSVAVGDGTERRLTQADREAITLANDTLSSQALRVLALGYRRSTEPMSPHEMHTVERDIVFAALVGMIDPPREEVFAAVERARAAGILPIMITGDNKLTAMAIATEIGTFRDGDRALSGEDLDMLSDSDLAEILPTVKVYARVNPEHKLRVVRAWRSRGETIAMTGDGVNDAPALKEADIGVAMGITGTDVSKEAADMVLTDDNFASIVSAVEEGRGIFDNIRKVVHFLLSCNIGEILVLLVASLTGMPLPLLPVQILWTNLVTDGLPALGLSMERIDPGVMDRPPRRRDEGIVTRPLMWIMLVQGTFIAVCTLGVYTMEYYHFGSGLEKARTMAFSVLVFCQYFHAYNCRSMRKSVFRIGIFSNSLVNLSALVIVVSQVVVIYVPALHPIFKVTYLTPTDWVVVVAASVQPFVWMEVVKLFIGKGKGRGRRGNPGGSMARSAEGAR